MKKCKYCNKDFKEYNNSKFCSTTCGYRFRRGISILDTNKVKKCTFCKKDFVSKRSNHKYCSHNCCNNSKLSRNPNNINGTHKKCITCNTIFASRGPAHKYCKLDCNINAKLAAALRSRLGKAIKNNQKVGSAVRDLGCSIEELKKHLETQFQEGMTWDNWTTDGWHIDHADALANFDLTKEIEFKKAVHYTNLQPMWAKENMHWGARNKDNNGRIDSEYVGGISSQF